MTRNVTDALSFISSSELYTSNYESYFNQVRYKELPAICLINSFMRHLYRRGFPQHLMAGPPPPSFLLQSYRYHRKPSSRQPACTWLGTKMGQNWYEIRSCQRDPASAVHAYRGEGTKNEDLAKRFPAAGSASLEQTSVKPEFQIHFGCTRMNFPFAWTSRKRKLFLEEIRNKRRYNGNCLPCGG